MTTAAMTNSQKLSEFTKIFQQQSKDNFYDSTQQSQNALQTTAVGAHYEVPNLSSMLYEFTNREQDRILQGFRIGNFVSLRDLPADINPGNVLNGQREKIETNLNFHPEPKAYVELQNGGGYFSKFDWKPEPFGLFIEQVRKEAQEKRDKQLQIHGNIPFYSHPKKQIQPKHISVFETQIENVDALASFYGEDDPYENSRFEILREKWISDSKILYGDFKPSQSLLSLKQINKQHLPEVVGMIKRNLLADWSNINFVIGTNPEDFIEMRFDALSLDSPKGLHAYLNNLVNGNEFLLKYQLRRVTEYWGVYSDDQQYIFYMLAPPYVKIKNPTLYLKQIQNISSAPPS